MLTEEEKKKIADIPYPITHVIKRKWKHSQTESLIICINNEEALLETYNIGNKYKGIEYDRKYTLKELGIYDTDR